MSEWRRVLLAFYSVVLLAFCGLLVALAWDQSRQLDIDLEGFRLVAGITSGDAEKLLFTCMVGAIAIFALISLLVAVMPVARRRDVLRVTQADGSAADVTAGAVAAVLQDELERLPDVRRAYPAVEFVGRYVEADIALSLEPGAVVSHVTGAVIHTTAVALREHFNITAVRRPSLQVSFDGPDRPSYPVSRMPPPVPAERVIGGAEPPPAGPYPPAQPYAPGTPYAPPGAPRPPRPNDGRLEFPVDDRG